MIKFRKIALNGKKIKPVIKSAVFFGSLIIVLVGGVLGLSPSVLLAQTGTTYWNVERDAANNLNFYLTNNGTTAAAGFSIAANGTPTANNMMTVRQGFYTGYAGSDSGLTGDRPYQWGYQEGGAWTSPYPDLILGYHTGVKIGANYGYGGVKFFSDHPSRSTTQLFSVGDGDQNVRVANWLMFPNGGGGSGISSPTNSAVFYPNNGTYGAWNIQGNRNGWGGIEFGAPYNAAQGISLMVGHTSQNNSNVYTGFHMNGVGWLWYATGSNLVASQFVDKDNGSYLIDANGTSQVNYLYRGYGYNGYEYDANNTGYYVDPSYVSQFSYLYRTYGFNGPEYDANNTGYYLDPNSTSNSYASYRYYGFNGPEYDGNNGGYYIDLNGNSRMSNAYFDKTLINWPGYNGITQAYGHHIWPGRNDGSGADWQQSWYLASNSSYGLYTNTGMYFAGGIYTPRMYDTANANYFTQPGGQSKMNNIWLDYMSCMSSWCPANYVMRLTPNLHLNSVGGYAVYVNWDNGFPGGGAYEFVVGNGAGSYAMISRADGALYAAASGWIASDERLKKNIQPVGNALEKVLALSGVSFEYRKDIPNHTPPDGRHMGVIAQQVEKVVPEAVSDGPDGYKSVAYTDLIPVLIEGIKEQNTQVTSQKQEIEQLKQEVAELKNAINELKR